MEWLSFRERVGDDIASGVAWSGLNVLSRLRGAEGCRSFLQSILGRTVPNDARGWWSDRGRPIEREIERCAGVRWPEFVAAWTAELAVTATELESELAKLPRITGAVTFEPISPDSRVVKYRVSIEPPPTAGDSRVAFLYAELGAFDAEVDPHDWRREEFDFAVDTAGDLPGSLGRGGRFFSTFALDVEELGCAVISGWARQEVR
jgi:hypothetical protein